MHGAPVCAYQADEACRLQEHEQQNYDDGARWAGIDVPCMSMPRDQFTTRLGVSTLGIQVWLEFDSQESNTNESTGFCTS